jgi:hypothetical protein
MAARVQPASLRSVDPASFLFRRLDHIVSHFNLDRLVSQLYGDHGSGWPYGPDESPFASSQRPKQQLDFLVWMEGGRPLHMAASHTGQIEQRC